MLRRLLPLALLLTGCNLAGDPTRLQPPRYVIHHKDLPDPLEQAEATREAQKTWDQAWEKFQREQAAHQPKPSAATLVAKGPGRQAPRLPQRRAHRMVAWTASRTPTPSRS